MTHTIQIAASILSADFANLGAECCGIINAGANSIHFDVMDHHFVPNLTFGAHVCSALRKYGISAEIDVHLMVTHPEQYISVFAKAGANRITFHPIVVSDPVALCCKIHDAGMQAGLAFNPDQSVQLTDALWSSIDMILIMSVFAGLGGQQFIENSISKIMSTKKLIDQQNSNILLGVDGGIKTTNIRDVVQAGANFIIMGSGLFNTDNYVKRMQQLRELIADRQTRNAFDDRQL